MLSHQVLGKHLLRTQMKNSIGMLGQRATRRINQMKNEATIMLGESECKMVSTESQICTEQLTRHDSFLC